MSTKQLVATKSQNSTKCKAKTSITVEQSQKLIQTMLTMSFGCLAFLRGFFPDDSFVDQRFVPEKVERNYMKEDSNPASSIRIKTLVRGKSHEIDTFLNWLEKGVFQAIKLKYLKALSLGVFLDENNPTELLENYIFSFRYGDMENLEMEIGTDTESKDKATISLLDSRKMAQQLIRRFIIITQSLDPLPQRKFLTLRLMFNDNTPPDYQPTLFKDASFEKPATVKIPLSAESNSIMVGSLDTNHHQLALKVLSSADYGDELDDREETDFIEIDPFDFAQDSVSEEVHSQNQLKSQTANLLGEFLKSSQNSIQPTQAIINNNSDNVTCECCEYCPTKSTAIKVCKTCRKKVHGICYGNSKRTTIDQCMTCVDGKLDVDNDRFKDLMMLRKVYRLFARLRSMPGSISQFIEQLFGNCSDCDKELEERLAFCLSVLFHDEILSIEDKEKKAQNSQNSKFSGSVLVDISGINVPVLGELSKNNTLFFSFRYQSSDMHSCFTDVIALSRDQIEDWLEQIQHLRDFFIMSSNSSPNIESLKIKDKGSFESAKQSKKRKKNDLHQYLSSEQSSHSIEDATPDLNCTKKIRKISVSKRSLRSVW